MEAGVFCQPFLDLGMLVRGVVVDDQVQIQRFWRLPVELAQETEEFLMPVAFLALADDRAVEHIQRREQRGRAIALESWVMVPARPFFIGTGWVRSSAWIWPSRPEYTSALSGGFR